MGLFNWMEGKIKTFSIWDFSILKVYLLLMGMIFGAYLSSFVKQYLTAIIVIIVMAMIWLVYKMFK